MTAPVRHTVHQTREAGRMALEENLTVILQADGSILMKPCTIDIDEIKKDDQAKPKAW